MCLTKLCCHFHKRKERFQQLRETIVKFCANRDTVGATQHLFSGGSNQGRTDDLVRRIRLWLEILEDGELRTCLKRKNCGLWRNEVPQTKSQTRDWPATRTEF